MGETNDESGKRMNLETPQEMSIDEFKELELEVSKLSIGDAEKEWLESCRYGEVDVLRALLKRFPSLIGHKDAQTANSGLHMASANGHVPVVEFLVYHKHAFTKNASGNTPLHWAASNGQADVVSFFTKTLGDDLDVLEKNEFGRSALTEGFSSQKEGVVELLLEHSSASEEKLLSVDKTTKSEVIHKFFDPPVLVRELAIINADDPFANAEKPDQDTTGLSIWSASLVLARWLASKSCWKNSRVIELGAGCGVPGLTIALCDAAPEKVYISDLNPLTVDNIEHNINLNDLTNAQALRMDWCDKETWPKDEIDIVVGSDLIYQKSLVPLLSSVVFELLGKKGGFFYYVAPDSGRDGLDTFIEEMKAKCPGWVQTDALKEYYENPLTSGDEEECFLHFQELSTLKFILYEFPVPPSA